MTDKLSEYELLNIMDGVFSYYLDELGHERDKPRIRQTKKQIVALIQKEAERDEIEASYIDIVIDLYDQLEQKKPQVTEKWIEERAQEVMFLVDDVDTAWSRKVLNVRDFIRSLVEGVVGK